MSTLPSSVTQAIEKILQQGTIPREALTRALENLGDEQAQLDFLKQLEADEGANYDEETRVFREDWYGNTLGSVLFFLENNSAPDLIPEALLNALENIDNWDPAIYYSQPERAQNIKQNVTSEPFPTYFPTELHSYARKLIERVKSEVFKGRTPQQLLAESNLNRELAAMQNINNEAKSITSMEKVREHLAEYRKNDRPYSRENYRLAA